MAYDGSLDKQLFSKSLESNGGKIVVGVYSYNNGPKKLQLTRENITEDGETRFAKLGRLTKQELEGILPFIQEALSSMD